MYASVTNLELVYTTMVLNEGQARRLAHALLLAIDLVSTKLSLFA